jgi:hypothetical protein
MKTFRISEHIYFPFGCLFKSLILLDAFTYYINRIQSRN